MKVLNEPDILYNFIVAGDERIYEGRGWEKASYETKNNLLTLALIGKRPIIFSSQLYLTK